MLFDLRDGFDVGYLRDMIKWREYVLCDDDLIECKLIYISFLCLFFADKQHYVWLSCAHPMLIISVHMKYVFFSISSKISDQDLIGQAIRDCKMCKIVNFSVKQNCLLKDKKGVQDGGGGTSHHLVVASSSRYT